MIPFAEKSEIDQSLKFSELIRRIGTAFSRNSAITPMRHHHDFQNPTEDKDSTLLLMPSWVPGENLGVKVVTISPHNSKYQMPSIQGIYLLFDAVKGNCKLQLDAKALTVKRTAATSALASTLLSRNNSEIMLMVGTGALAIPLIQAHACVRPLKKVMIWGRNFQHAQNIAKEFKSSDIHCEPIKDLQEGVRKADIISCATLSETALIHGQYLHSGQHLDMVGAYRPHMREADNETIRRSKIFVDHYPGALKETGDIVIPIQEGVISKADIQADLHELCSGFRKGRSSDDEITFFKSVGHALEDLVAAEMVYEYLQQKSKVNG